MKRFYITFIVVFLITIIIFLKPLSLYFEQKYEFPLPLKFKNSILIKNSERIINFFKKEDKKVENYATKPTVINIKNSEELFEDYYETLYGKHTFEKYVKDFMPKNKKFMNHNILIMGDSIMKDIALSFIKTIDNKKEKYNVANLSKPSTGLNNKDFYDASLVLKNEIKKLNISILVILYGTNDAWSIYKNNKKYNFADENWKNFYKNRVDEILNIAKENNIKVFWLELPCMQSNKFDEKMSELNDIYKERLQAFDDVFIRTKDAICTNNKFEKYLTIGKKTHKVRNDDGIHLSIIGSQIISDLTLKALKDYELNIND